MKINILLTDSENKLEAILEKSSNDETLWTGFVEGFNEDEYRISIKLDKNNQINSIQKGSKIASSHNELKEEFRRNLIAIAENKIENEIAGIEDTLEEADLHQEPQPYDPELIRVETKSMSISYVFEMMTGRQKDLDLSPDFQRNFVWTDITRKSRLIESILLRIPLPVFYLSQDQNGILQVVDGVQRLTVIKDYLNNEFKLKNLEYLEDCSGCFFEQEGAKSLDPKYVRRIKQTQLIFNIIDPQTPSKVKFEIFKRINTGGKPLNNQEVRNCLASYRVRSMLKDLSNSKEFLKTTSESISKIRMADQELVMRFIGFYYLKELENENLKYKGDMDQFLDDTLELLNKRESELTLNKIKNAFLNAMNITYYLFGDYSFRKCKPEHLKPEARKQLINKSLFTSLSILLYNYDFNEITKKNTQGCLIQPFAIELDSNQSFNNAITVGTNDRKKIDLTFGIVKKIINDNLKV